MSYNRPSIIQSHSLRHIMDKPTTNFAFQAINGSGKTGAFVVPSLMKVDPEIKKIQVVIFANTRELIRQIQQVSCIIAKSLQINITLGEPGAKLEGTHILITTPGFVKSRIDSRSGPIDLSALKMIVYDEADELFIQEEILKSFEVTFRHLKKLGIVPQHILFSATYNAVVIDKIKTFIGDTETFLIQKEALKLKGVKNFKILLDAQGKVDFTSKMHTVLDQAMTMVFVNKKDSAYTLQNKLKTANIEAKILTGGIETEVRDKMIDQFRLNKFSTLISTNVLARGIDVPEVDVVLNFDVPIVMKEGWMDPDYANFMHRVGRTGRFGTDGIAVTLMADENDEEMMRLIGKHYEIEIAELKSFDQLVQAIEEMRGKM